MRQVCCQKGGEKETMKPRKPSSAEKQELIDLYVTEFGQEHDHFTQVVDNSAIAVFDNYSTAMPGYQGKVLSVVWEDGPTIFDVLTWRDGNLRVEERG